MKQVLCWHFRFERFALFVSGLVLLSFVQSARADNANEATIRQKMERIMFDSIEYKQANIVDVIHDLSDLSRENDSSEKEDKNKGINFFLDLGDEDEFWGDDPTAGIPPITIMARNINLRTALDTVMEMSGLEYNVHDNIVAISRKHTASGTSTGLEHPLLSAQSVQVVKSFDARKVRRPEDWRWFYYVPGTAKLSEQAVEVTKLGFKKEPKSTHVVLLFDSVSKTVFWKWIAAPPAKLFAKNDKANLAEICFGLDPLVEGLWMRHNPDWDHRWSVSSRLLSGVIYGGNVAELETVMGWIQDDWETEKMPEFSRLQRTFDSQTNRLNKIRMRLDFLQEEITRLDQQINEARQARYRHSNTWKTSASDDRLSREQQQMRVEQQHLFSDYKNLFTETKATAAKIDRIRADYQKSREREPLEAAVRKMEFTVSVVIKGEEKR